jgi:hypothetical protein
MNASGTAPVLLIAGSVVAIGTAWADPGRITLLLVPLFFLSMTYGAGALLDRVIGGLLSGSDHPWTAMFAVRVGIGLACLSLLTVTCAFGGVLWLAGAVALPLSAYGLFRTIRAGVQLRLRREDVFPAPALVVGAAWLVGWLWATIPPTFYDELAYHLVIPQRALVTGSTWAAPGVLSLMPHASDLLLGWGMLLGGDLGARAAVATFWMVCSLAAWGLAECIAWPRTSPWAAPLVISALAASPMLWFLATLPFAETALSAAMVTAAVVLASSSAPTRPWLALGLALGFAASIKLSGLYWVAAGLAAAVVAGWTRAEVFRAGLIALAGVVPWWIRAYVHTGNPVYPMWFRLLGGQPWSEESQARLMADLPYGLPGSLGWEGLLRLPLDLVLHPERFGSASDVGPVAVVVTCLAMPLPLLVRVAGAGARGRRLADAAAVFVLVAGAGWIITSPTTRFFAPAFVIGLAGLCGALLQLGRFRLTVVVVLMVAGGVWGGHRFLNQHAAVFSTTDVAMGRERADAYLARQVDHYAAARFVRERLSQDARLLFIGETRPYYFFREAVAPYPYDAHPLHRWVQESQSVEALTERLVREGITHVVLNVREFKRHHDTRGVLAFSGEGAEADDKRLKELPRALRLLFAANGVYVLEVPRR